jgi:hypothetical protein
VLPWLLDEFLSAPLRAVESSRRRNVWKRTVPLPVHFVLDQAAKALAGGTAKLQYRSIVG